MRKYLEVFRLSFKMQIVWRFDVVMTMVATVARILAGWIVWQVIFEGRDTVGGFTFQAMLSYYLIGAVIRSVNFSEQISGEVSWLIRSGAFSGHMAVPMNPMGFFSAMTAGETAFHLGFSLIAAAVCTAAFGVGITVTGDAARILPAAALVLLGLAFTAVFQYFMGILTFKYLDIQFLLYVQMNIIAFTTGSMVPLSLLPKAVLSALQWLPFTHVLYTPVMLLTGQMAARDGLFGLAVLAAWTWGMLSVTKRTYTRLRVSYDGVGI
jgi:ABC-2 type transport system permease protein